MIKMKQFFGTPFSTAECQFNEWSARHDDVNIESYDIQVISEQTGAYMLTIFYDDNYVD